MRLHQEPDSANVIVALAPVVEMDLIRFRITGGVGLAQTGSQTGRGTPADMTRDNEARRAVGFWAQLRAVWLAG